MPRSLPKIQKISKFHETLIGESIAGQVPSDWFNYLRILLLASKYEYVSQIFVCELISELTFCWGPCGKTKFRNNEILLSLDPDSLENVTNPTVKSKLKILSESFGPNGKWSLTEPDNIGDRDWINNETDDDFIYCPSELEDKFYLTAHENTIPNLQECINENVPIIISHFSFHTPHDGRHANYLFFIKTSEGYICFRGDPWGFGESSSAFKPDILDEYLKIYFKELDVTYYTHKELIPSSTCKCVIGNVRFPILYMQSNLDQLNKKCGDEPGFCSTWVVVIVSLILKWIDLKVVKHVGNDLIVFENMNKKDTLIEIEKMFEFIQKYIDIDEETPSQRPPKIARIGGGIKRTREFYEGRTRDESKLPRITRFITEFFGNHPDETFDEYMINININYNSEIIQKLEQMMFKIEHHRKKIPDENMCALDPPRREDLEKKDYDDLVNEAKDADIDYSKIEEAKNMGGKEALIELIRTNTGIGQFRASFQSIQNLLHTESAFTSSNQNMVIKILKCIKKIDPGIIDHKGIHYEFLKGGYKKNKHKKKSTKKPKKSKRPKKIKKSKRLRKKSRRKRK